MYVERGSKGKCDAMGELAELDTEQVTYQIRRGLQCPDAIQYM